MHKHARACPRARISHIQPPEDPLRSTLTETLLV